MGKKTFYDRRNKTWVTQTLDRFGNQIGNADYSYEKPKGIRKKRIR
jgi:hypothetical protein